MIVSRIAKHFNKLDLPFPSTKAKAIVVKTFKPGHPDQPLFSLNKGSTTDFPIPEFAKHEGSSWSLANLSVEIGEVEKTGIEIVDNFNQMVVDVFNIAAGNMLKNGNILTWNVWVTAPEYVDVKEWKDHAIKWRHSIDIDHASPDGPGTDARYFDGSPFKPLKEFVIDELPRIIAFVQKHLKPVSRG